MYAAIRRMQVYPGEFEEALRRIENGLVPIPSSVPGFVEYVGVHVEQDVGVTISFFETQAQAEASNSRAAEWVTAHLAPLAAGPHEMVAVGEVRLRQAK